MTVVAEQSVVEAEALKQLRSTAELPGVVLAVGLPDLHVGSSCPVGAAIATVGIIYPALVGSDIGCGVMLAKTSLAAAAASKMRTVERWATSLQLEGPWNVDISGITCYLLPYSADSSFSKDRSVTVRCIYRNTRGSWGDCNSL